MADEILGHENLDHGKHLKHHAHKPRPGERFGRGSRPVHVALHRRVPSHANHQAHGPNAHAHDAHAVDAHHATGKMNWRAWVIGLAIALPLVFLFANSYPAFAALILILVLNTGIEYHKYFTAGAPLDIEILYISGAYLASVHGFVWGLVLALIGPALAEMARADFHGDTVAIKTFGVLVAVGAAAILSPTVPELIFAVLLGNIAQYLGLLVMDKTNGIMSVIRRLTTIGFGAYLIAFILPHLVALK